MRIETIRPLLAVAAATALAATVPASGDASGEPRLRLLHRQPLTVAGAGFAARETVRLTVVVADATRTRIVTASHRGAFTARFAAISYDRCTATVVRATGKRGSRALLKVPQPLCPPLRP